MKLSLILAFCCAFVLNVCHCLVIEPSTSACKVQQALVEKYGNLLSFYPRCDGDGNYAAIQCRQAFCWCANKEGVQLTVSKPEYPDCSMFRR